MDITSLVLGMKVGKASVKAESDWNQAFATAMIVRNGKALGSETILDTRSFKLAGNATLGNINGYAFAGFTQITHMLLANSFYFDAYAFYDCPKLKVIDVTVGNLNIAGFRPNALSSLTSLESIIVRRQGDYTVNQVFVSNTACEHSNFYVYVPRDDYDTVIANIQSNNISADRYRILEDYPEVNLWNETFTARFWDGDVLLKEMTVKCGESAVPPDTTKEGYKFKGWTPSDFKIYEDTDFIGEWVEPAGFEYVTTVAKTLSGELTDFALNPDGNLVLMALNGSGIKSPGVYDISSGEAVQKTYNDTSTTIYTQYCDFNYDGSVTAVGADKYGYCWNTADGSYKKSINFNNNRIVCGNVNNWMAGITGSYPSYTLSVKDIDSSSVISTTSKISYPSVTRMEFSPDDQYLAQCDKYAVEGGVQVFRTSDGASVKSIAVSKGVNNVSWNSDGSRLLLTLNVSPWVEVYDTTTWEKVCDLGSYFSSTTYAFFLAGTDVIVAGSGTTVKAFELAGTEVSEMTKVPTYSGGSVTQIRSNKSGSHIGIACSSGIEVWRMKE